MRHVIVVGAGITGVTTAYELTLLGYQVTVVDRHLYPAMETSFANGGQLSACNAEVWNQNHCVERHQMDVTKPHRYCLILLLVCINIAG